MKESELRHQEAFRSRWARPFAYLWAVFAVYLLIDAFRRADGRQLVLTVSAVVAISLVVYATAYRPAVVIDDAGVLLRNIVRDIYVPWPKVDDIDRTWVLAIEAEGRRYVAWAVSARNPAREGRSPQSEAGVLPGRIASKRPDAAVQARQPAEAAPAGSAAGSPSERVMDRWMAWRHKVPDGPVSMTFQWAVGAALAVTVAVFVVALLLG